MLASLSRRALPLLHRPSIGALGHAARQCSAAALEHASSCYLPTSWMELPLVAKREHNHDSTVYSFGLPEGQSLNLPVCACLLLRVPGTPDDVVRPYTPISDNETTGSFDLLVKRYPGGAASQYLHGLELGATVGFKHIKFNVKQQYPFGKRSVSMLCAGSGVTPMYQALLKLVDTPGDATEVVLLYGNKSVDDILMREELDELVRRAQGRLKVVHVVGAKADAALPAGWASTETFTAEAGWVDKDKIQKYCFAPSDDTLVFVCGLPSMYEALCGPRTEPLAEGTILHELGYQPGMCVKM